MHFFFHFFIQTYFMSRAFRQCGSISGNDKFGFRLGPECEFRMGQVKSVQLRTFFYRFTCFVIASVVFMWFGQMLVYIFFKCQNCPYISYICKTGEGLYVYSYVSALCQETCKITYRGNSDIFWYANAHLLCTNGESWLYVYSYVSALCQEKCKLTYWGNSDVFQYVSALYQDGD